MSSKKRFLKLAGMTASIAGKAAKNSIKSFAGSEEDKLTARSEMLQTVGLQIADTLGEMKGAVMKVGQIASQYKDIFPPEVAKAISKLQRPAYYTQFAESFEAAEEVIIPEEVQDDLINRLTIRTFNEDLKAVFPYIYKFVNETELPVVELSADDLLNETTLEMLRIKDEVIELPRFYRKDIA